MKNLLWRLFVWVARLRGHPIPRHVNRYALVLTGKKPFHEWVRGLKNPRISPATARAWQKVYLLSFDILPEEDNALAGPALRQLVLDFLSDFPDDERDLPKLEPHMLLKWFDFQQIDEVMDISSTGLKARPYSF